MLTYALRRVLYSIPVLLIASFLLFVSVRATFDPTARLAASKDPQVQQRERERLGLNDSIFVQYGDWLKGALHGDLGQSSASRDDVSSMISRAMGNTMQLILIGAVVSAAIAIGVGVYSAVKQYSKLDYLFTGLSYIGIAMPPFWFGLLLIEFFVVQNRWFLSVGLHTGDSTGFDLDYLKHLVLPIATLCVQIVASWSRYQRASMLDSLGADYVRTARAKGVPRRKVIVKHALRNSLIPFVTVVALDFGALFGGLIITENIFAIGGMGRLFYNALLVGDVYVVQAWMIIVAIIIILFNLFADLLYGVLDPDPAFVRTEHDIGDVEPAPLGSPVAAEPMRDFVPDQHEPTARSQWQLFRRRFLRHRFAVAGGIILILLIVLCFGASRFAPYPKNHQDLVLGPTSPSREHLMGTDQLGRDQFTEILYAGQISLKIGLAVALVSTVVGTVVGAAAGYFGRFTDQLLMRFTDLFLVVPAIAVLAIALKRFGQTDTIIILVLAGLGWMYIARVVRGQVLSIKEKEFVEAARAAGGSSPRIVFRHILPNCMGPILVNATLSIAAAIVTESTLSFLGFGVQPPATSWGNMLAAAEGNYNQNTHLLYFPGLMILLTVLCVNFLGDGLRDGFDPQAKH